MSLPYSPSITIFNGNGVATQFPFSFKVWEVSQLVVSVVSPEGIVEQMPFTASLTNSGGTVTFLMNNAPLPTGWRLSVMRDMPFDQEVDLITGTRFDPQVIENALDRATAERQQLREAVGRAIVVPPGDERPPELLAQEIFDARDQAAGSAAEAGQSADRAAAEANRVVAEVDSIKKLTVDVEDIPHGTTSQGVYNPTTGVLTLHIPEGATGHQGPQGAEGPQGIAGAFGPQGPRGSQGIQGTQGERGFEGQQGNTGAQGIQGPHGPQGDVGPLGPQGIQGETGERGPQGVEGPKGARGDKGPLGDSPLPLTFGNMRVNTRGYLEFEYNGGPLDKNIFSINPATGEMEVHL